MALNTTGLPEAYKRKELGTATKTDKDNITYAESKGYKLPEQVSSANSTEPTSPVNNPTKPVAINGAEYNTREKQQEAYTDIKPVGDTLYGVAKTPIVPNVIPQKDFDSTMSPEDLSTTEETANKMVDFNDKQVNNLNKAYQRQILGTATETDINNINYATEKGWQPAEAEEEKEITVKSDAVLGKADVNKSTTDQIFEKYSNVGAEEEAARQQAIKDTKLMEKGEAIAVAETLVNNYRTELQNQAIIDIKEEDAIRSKPILTAQIQGQLNSLSREQKLDTMILQNNYNNALVRLQTAQGNYDRAKEIVEETAEDTYKASMLQIEALKYKNEIEAVEADRLEANLEYERELSLNGYVHIKSADGLKGLNESDLFRDPVSGKIYKKPEADISQVININGRMKGIDSQGNVIRDFGSSSSGLSVSEQMALIGAGLTMDDDGNITRDTSSANATQIANAIKQIESNNNYEAKGASGEYGAYQFMPATWDSWSSDYANKVLGQSTRRLEQTPENQDAVAEFKIQQWLSQGLSSEQIAAKWNSGSEIGWENKIGVNKQGVAYNVPNYVKKFNQALGTKVGTGETDAFTTLQATNLVADAIGPRGVNNKELVSATAELLAGGMNKDDVADMLRYSEQSLDYGEWRSVSNNAFSSIPPTQRKMIEDGLDDFIEAGDMSGAKDYILKVSRDKASGDERKNVVAREEALTAINIIEDELDKYIEMGGSTGLLTGNIEKLHQRVLKKTKDPLLAEIANTISQTIQTYRQQLTGAAFTESEAKEYNRLFPNIKKSPELNTALINSLKSQYERNMRLFYERQLGKTGYTKLESITNEPIVGTGDLSRFTFNNNTSSDLTKNYLTNYGY